MSVINKVLRDLDQRASAAGAPQAGPTGGDALTRGTSSVDAPPDLRVAGSARAAWMLAGVMAAALAAGGWWWSGLGGIAARPSDRTPASTLSEPSPVPTTSVAAIVATAPAATGGAAMVVPVQPQEVPQLAGRAPAQEAGAPPVPAAPVAPAAAPTARPAAMATRPVLEFPPPAGRLALPAASAEPSPADMPRTKSQAAVRAEPLPVSGSTPVPWQDSALEAVSQAQKMWNLGARDAAVDLVRDALAGVERAHGADLVPAGAGAVVGLVMVRELVRMEMLLSQHAAALTLLRRHERLWAGQADLWAVRGSAAQRLAQHAESGQSYLMALKIRPGEPRWMLGAAVALAALGQLAQAAELADQARALGGANPEVLAYLRQLGVAIRE